MWSSAVSGFLALAAPVQAADLTAQEKQAWSGLRESFAVVLQGERPAGSAALIDERGLFVAHRTSVGANVVRARLASGKVVELRLRNQDERSQLVLLQATNWDATLARPVTAPMAEPRAGERLLAVLATGPIRAEFVAGGRVGLHGPSQRLLPLNEVRFEAPEGAVGGALVVTMDGELVGALNATLSAEPEKSVQRIPLGNAASNTRTLDAILGRGAPAPAAMGPAVMTVAYTVGPEMMRRVIDGFRSAEGRVEHPALGAFCGDAKGGGALVHKVEPGSPADQAGLRVNDVIVEMNGTLIQEGMDFARVLMRLDVGSKLTMRVRRGPAQVILNAVVGVQTE
jgi:serine protease DegS